MPQTITKARFTVIPNPPGRLKKGGYAIQDSNPGWIHGEDVEGVGWYQYRQPRRASSVICWFKRKCDAQKHADNLNKWNDERDGQFTP